MHEDALAPQKLCLDAAGLIETFTPLLKLVREMQGICARKVDLTCGIIEDQLSCSRVVDHHEHRHSLKLVVCGLKELPEDLRGISHDFRELSVESQQLKELPVWIGEFAYLESLVLEGGSIQYLGKSG